MRLPWQPVIVAALLAASLFCEAASAGAAPTMTEFPLPSGGRSPAGITAGPDGNVWFAESAGSGGIGRITPTGTITEFTAGLSGQAESIALGPDGNLWFTEPSQEKIGRITPSGTITEFSLPGGSGSTKPAGIAAGRDGNLWFTVFSGHGAIGRITPAGTITEFANGLPPGTNPRGIAAGPDGNLWFTETANPARIARITPEGTITQFSAGLTANSKPQSITAGPDGNLWFTEEANPGRIGRITTAGAITQYETGLPTNIRPEGITAANDGHLYFTEFNNPGEIGRITTTGVITQTATPTTNSQPLGITTGPNGNLWFTEFAGGGKIGTLTVAPSVGSASASNVAEQTATLAAPVGANSQATEYFFQYGPSTEYGSQTSTASAGSGATPAAVSANALGLSPTTTYHFRAVAKNASGTTYGPDQTFTTTSAPTANTLPATDATLTGGTLHATIDPQGQATTYHFDWGTSASYGRQAPVADASVGSDGSEHAVEQTLGELTPGTTYHFRVVASNCGGCADGTTYGPDETFTTLVLPYSGTASMPTVMSSPSLSTSPPTTIAPPEIGKTAVAGVISGVVLIRVPDASGLVALGTSQDIPIGSMIDAQHGVVSLTTAVNPAGKVQSATLWHGSFAVGQRPGAGMTTFTLPRPSGCATGVGRSHASRASAARAKTQPTLWAKDNHGQYSTRGQNSVATVRGTYWETTNRCDGTLTTVKQGLVSVRDLHRHRSVLVRAGDSYLAKR